MKLALFADIHSNLEAITACLAHANALGADRYAFLGDLVGYGADPVAVLDLIEEHAANGAVVVLGNHDAAAIGRPDDALNRNALAAVDWTRAQLGARQQAFLASLPLTVADDDILFVHASAAAPEQWIYVSGLREAEESLRAGKATLHLQRPRARAEALLHRRHGQGRCLSPGAGHADSRREASPMARHRRLGGPAARRQQRGLLCACSTRERERLTFYRVPYDHGAAIREDPRGRTSRAARAAPGARHVMSAPEPGSVIDGFRLGEMIHAGSMASIFRLDGPDGRCRSS